LYVPFTLYELQACLGTSLRERNNGLTASNYADGNLSGSSAQHEDKTCKQDCHRHIIAVGIGRASYADGRRRHSLAVDINIFLYSFVIMADLCRRLPSAQPPSTQIFWDDVLIFPYQFETSKYDMDVIWMHARMV
jgi:hypothetical protein